MRKKLNVFNLYVVLFPLFLGAGCTPLARKSAGQYQQGATDRPQVSEQRNIEKKEQPLLQEMEHLIQTMSLEELIQVILLDAEDSNEDASIDAQRKKLYDLYGSMPIEEARANVSATVVHVIGSWLSQPPSFLVCKILNAREKNKIITNEKVKQFISLYTLLLVLIVQQQQLAK